MPSTADEFRTALKWGKRALKQGDAIKAEHWLQRAREFALYLKDDHRRSFVVHRLAEVAVLRNEPMLARHRFKRALELVNKNSHVAYAIMLRDYGEFERRQGHPKIARRHVEKAARLLLTAEPVTRRVKLEGIVTEGFTARLDLADKNRRAQALAQLKELADELYGTHKTQYELANLAVLAEELPVWDIDRTKYILRAMFLSFRLRNIARTTEFTLLLGGKPLRGVYRVTTR